MDTRPLRVGILVDDTRLPYLVWDLLERSARRSEYRIEALIVAETGSDRELSPGARLRRFVRRRGVRRLLDRLAFEALWRAERLLTMRRSRLGKALESRDAAGFGVRRITVRPEISRNGLVHRYPAEALEAIRNLDLDVLIRGGSGILRGNILELCPLGILSFHHGDNRVNRGGPPGFWEVHERQPCSGFVIQRLTEELDGGEVLLRGRIATAPLYLLNLCRLYIKSSPFLDRLLTQLANGRRMPPAATRVPYAYPLYGMPSLPAQASYCTRTFLHFAKKAVRKALRRDYRWGVAYQYAADWRSTVLRRSRMIRNPPSRYFADPFVARASGRDVIFVEDYSYRQRKACISAIEVREDSCSFLGPVISEPFHLSYPFVFQAGDTFCICPESREAGDIRVYVCEEFPIKWRLHRILTKDVRAVDTSVLHHGGRWWLLTNLDSSGLGDSGSELHLFHADSLESTEWHGHPLNPVIFDSLRARNGGILFDAEGEPYRVFQRHGFDLYGKSMGVAKIVTLSETEYEEEVCFDIEPRFLKGICGTHTYSFHEGLLAIDFMRRERTGT